MALDGIFLNLLKQETENQILNSRVEKIHQPSRDELVFSFRTRNGAKKLFLSARADGARVHITNILPENPEKPPMFCLLLRKRLSGARLVEIRQQSLERIVELVFNATDELGDEVVYSLFVEIMSRRSNIILVKDGVIVDSIKRIDESKSSVRQILPGEKYCFPPKQEKYNIFDCDLNELNGKIYGSEKSLSKAAMENIMGISPVISREFEAGLTVEKLLLYAKNPKPYILFENDRAFDFTFIPISQYGSLVVEKEYESFGQLLDFYYFERERRERTKQKAHDLYITVSNLCERSRRKIFNRQKELEACEDKEKFRMYGDLISANMYVLKKGSLLYTVNDFYTGEEVKISADPSLTPSQNAQKYYKEYRKKQVAEQKLTGFIQLAEEECAYLETVLDEIERAQSSSDIAEIKKELSEMGYLKKRNVKNKHSKPLPPYEYISDDGFEILAGRNNIQNDKLTLKESRKSDVWFHSKDFPGSHIIVRTDGKDLPEKTIMQAAQIAAFHSKQSNSSNVAIDFTTVKNVKKPSGAKPGKVIYTDYKTVYVTPSVEVVERLIKKVKVTAVVLGAGSGTRMKASVNKVFLEIAGVPVIKRSVDAFLNCKFIDEVVVVCKENDLCEMKKLFCDSPVNFVVGGETRQQSVKNAVESIENCDYIVIHDGARPFVTQTVIESTLADAVKYKAPATGVYVKDTIKVVDKDGFIVSTPDRSSLISIQTPQIFDFDIYKKACENAVKKVINATDDCALVEMQGYNVKVTLGDYNNIKITTPEDLPLGESIVNMR